MEATLKIGKLLNFIIIGVPTLIVLGFVALVAFWGTMTISDLLTENKHLRQAITNLTQEDQIGYAKVISQETKGGRLFTTIKFVETARNNKLKKILEKDYTIEGDVVHFDALIVKFGDKMVMDGREKSLYLWRRIYGEKMAPDAGLPIEQPGVEPKRYDDLLKKLGQRQKKLFWSNIWELANDPDKLKEHDISAVYGNVVYSQLRKGLIYVFKITPTGQVYPEVVPEI